MTGIYHNVDILERTVISPDGKAAKIYRISAYTKSDVRFTLDVAEADFTKAKVDKLLTEKAQQIESIKAL